MLLGHHKLFMQLCNPFSHLEFFVLYFFRQIGLNQTRIWLQFSQTWLENFYMEEKGFLQKDHSSVHCPRNTQNGVNPRDLNNYKKMASFSETKSFLEYKGLSELGFEGQSGPGPRQISRSIQYLSSVTPISHMVDRFFSQVESQLHIFLLLNFNIYGDSSCRKFCNCNNSVL